MASESGAFCLLELRVSQHFSTFYGPSVQALDTQLNALATLPVLARSVSGCLNSAFLGLFLDQLRPPVFQAMDTQLGTDIDGGSDDPPRSCSTFEGPGVC